MRDRCGGRRPERFGVGKASAVRWYARFRDGGEIAPKTTGSDRSPPAIEAHAETILEICRARLQIFLRELREPWSSRVFEPARAGGGGSSVATASLVKRGSSRRRAAARRRKGCEPTGRRDAGLDSRPAATVGDHPPRPGCAGGGSGRPRGRERAGCILGHALAGAAPAR